MTILVTTNPPDWQEVAQRHGFTDLALFGSAARGNDRPDSDIDLLVQPTRGTDLFDMLRDKVAPRLAEI